MSDLRRLIVTTLIDLDRYMGITRSFSCSARSPSVRSANTVFSVCIKYRFFNSGNWVFLTLLSLSAISYEVASINLMGVLSGFYTAITENDRQAFTAVLFRSLLVTSFISMLYSIQSYTSEGCAIQWRERLGKVLQGGYVVDVRKLRAAKGMHSRKQPQIDGADQRITQDADRLTTQMSLLITNSIAIPFLIVYYTYYLWNLFGYAVPLACYAYFVVSTFCTALFSRAIVPIVYQQEKLEGIYRGQHVRFIEFYESISFLKGVSFEKAEVEKSFARALDNKWRITNWHLPLYLVANWFTYFGSVVNYAIIGFALLGLWNQAASSSSSSSGEGDDADNQTQSIVIGKLAAGSYACLYLINAFSRVLTSIEYYINVLGLSLRATELISAYFPDAEGEIQALPWYEDLSAGAGGEVLNSSHQNDASGIANADANVAVVETEKSWWNPGSCFKSTYSPSGKSYTRLRLSEASEPSALIRSFQSIRERASGLFWGICNRGLRDGGKQEGREGDPEAGGGEGREGDEAARTNTSVYSPFSGTSTTSKTQSDFGLNESLYSSKVLADQGVLLEVDDLCVRSSPRVYIQQQGQQQQEEQEQQEGLAPFSKVLIASLSLKVVSGQRILITGDSGCGKTTLLRYLARLEGEGEARAGAGTAESEQENVKNALPLSEGANESERQCIRSSLLFSQIWFVPQKAYVFKGSLLANIQYPHNVHNVCASHSSFGDSDDISGSVNIGAIVTALQAVRLGHLVESKTVRNGRDDKQSTITLRELLIEDDWPSRLSPGEQQRVEAARVLLACPRLLFLDEATSSLDEEMEATVYGEFLRVCDAVVSVGHRASIRRYHQVEKRIGSNGETSMIPITDTDRKTRG